MTSTQLLAIAALLGVTLYNLNRVIVRNLPTIKRGVDIEGLSPAMDVALLAVQEVAAAFGVRGVVTSALEDADDDGPGRVKDSFHPLGLAIDARRVDWPNVADTAKATQQRDMLAQILGPAFDVVLEPDHVHIERDPRQWA